MVNPVKKIGLFLMLFICIPIFFLAIRELYSLNENERIIEEIYNNQLESILFSVNQYSNDVARSWFMKIQTASENSGNDNRKLFELAKPILSENSAVKYIFISDSLNKNNVRIDSKEFSTNNDGLKTFIKTNQKIISRLYQYKTSGFAKIEPLLMDREKNLQFWLCITDNRKICTIAIDPDLFVTQNLISKIQSVAHDEFNAVVYDSLRNSIVYSSEQDGVIIPQQKKAFWLIPSYTLGISLKGATIEELVQERSHMNLYLLFGLSVLMFAFAWFGYRNIKREVELAQIKSDFVSNVSHELRTPLALINMFAETLSMGRVKSDEKRDEYYSIIQQETERLSKIVNKILNFSKIEAHKWEYRFVKTNLNELAGNIFTNYKFHLENKGFEFLLELADDELEIMLDKEAASEAIINLIDNAVKYSDNKKHIVIRTGRERKSSFIEVEDWGVGISSENQKKIFDKFFRVTEGSLHNTKGTGLGLTLVKHIMEAHKGEIKLTSTPGKGSSFRLVFPVE